MSYHQHLVDHRLWVKAEDIPKVFEKFKKDFGNGDVKETGNAQTNLEEAAAELNFAFTWSDFGDIDGIELIDSYQCSYEMALIGALAPFARPRDFITMIGEDQEVWQWWFNDGKVYTRNVALVGMPTPVEDHVRPDEVGYRYCKCRDCMELTIGKAGEYCDECTEAGCPEVQKLDPDTQLRGGECLKPHEEPEDARSSA